MPGAGFLFIGIAVPPFNRDRPKSRIGRHGTGSRGE